MAFKEAAGRSAKASGGSGKLARLAQRTGSVVPGYIDGDPRLLLAAVAAITLSGAAMRIGAAQGGRGLTITIYDGEDKHTDYIGDAIEFAEKLQLLYEAYQEGLSEDIGALLKLPK